MREYDVVTTPLLYSTLPTCPVKDNVSIQDNAAVSLGVKPLESAKSAMLREGIGHGLS